jgi:DNA adenine methylase
MPYIIKEVIDGYKVCKKDDKSECFSKKGLPLKRAKKQMIAINISEHQPLKGEGTHKENILKKYNLDDKGYSLEELAEITSKPLDILQQVYNRGIGAYKTNPQSVRMKVSFKKNVNAPMSKKLSKEQWAMARVYSFLDGNPSHDEDLRLEGGLKPISARIGGKVLLKKKLVDDYFPESGTYKTYVEPFVGGGSVYFYKNKDGHKEVVNDLDPSIYQLFKGFQKYAGLELADDVNGDYTEEDFNDIKESQPKDDYGKFLKTYLLYKLSYFGKGERFGKPRIHTSFIPYKERLENVDILNKDYKEVIEKYDSPSTFFYLDPPVREQTGKFNFPAIDFKQLDKICKSIKGKFLLSLADKPNDELFKGFNIVEIPTKYVQGRNKGGQSLKANEYLIMNYKPSEMSGEGEFLKTVPGFNQDALTQQINNAAGNKAAILQIRDTVRGFNRNLKNDIKKGSINTLLNQVSHDPQPGLRLKGILTGYGMEKFHKQLKEKNITHKQYMKAASKAAKKNGYDPSKLEMSDDGDHKLIYTTPEGKAVPFGKVDYNDFIIYTLTKNDFADKYRKAYLARATQIKGDWEKDKYSPNNLAINILW